METVSLDELAEQEHALLDDEYDIAHGLHCGTTCDRYMEINDARMGEDSEELTLRENRARKLLSQGSLPSYQPY
jgi:hypothetical protein